ncbi:hypothetical protein M409DRAFT_63548 [Zasmidium cellare ATCC 36951]|uniref:HMG box domain-containing protein n=1 Tax=Zasmidium cellare ATCC 36951 TaxID=1080233 RepID=A0A6A6CY96_ZASCE|nr:uncharacterized protein M409DRAFT_63548 [Zasmidium cellare ATCC 36951]KAF2171170.1 hypothetical protein M409DRAFT_63548 [Zasmidium cellare ATCC 36951]
MIGRALHGQVATGPMVLFLRTYATPGRPKSVVGEPSKPVKRAVKKAASKPPTGDSAAEKVVEANKRNAAKKTTKAKKKELTPAQKERAEQRKLQKQERLAKDKEKEKARKAKLKATTKASAEKEEIKELKKAALQPPHVKNGSSYLIFNAERMKEHNLSSGTIQDRREALGKAARDSSAQWKSLSPAEREHYNHLANSRMQESQADYKKWVESLSADEIQQANNARSTLRRKLEKARPKGKRSKWAPIHDERAVKRPVNSYAQFALNRNASGDFKGITLTERSKLIAQEWKALSDQEKSKYQRLGTQEAERYATEYKDVYSHEQPQAVAAAA